MSTSEDPIKRFGLNCPSGGTFYICSEAAQKFIGCCDINPCTSPLSGRCPTRNLHAASFNASRGAELLPQGCGGATSNNQWYTCQNSRPPFLGCCANDPCNEGCAEGNLLGAALSENEAYARQFLLPSTTSSTSSSSMTTSTRLSTGTSSSASVSVSASPTATDDAEKASSPKAQPTGLIVGVTIAGVVVLLLAIGGYLWYRRREEDRRMQGREEPNGVVPPTSAGVASNGFFQEEPGKTSQVTEASPFVDEGTFTAAYYPNRNPHHSQDGSFSPAQEEYYRNPHHSGLSELEGSLGPIRALQPHMFESYRGSDGR